VRRCVLVAAYASHPVLLNVTVYYKNLSMTTLNRSQCRTMILTRNRIRTQTETSWMQLMMTWQETHTRIHQQLLIKAAERAAEHRKEWERSQKNIPLSPFCRSIRFLLLLLSLLLLCLQDPISSSTPINHTLISQIITRSTKKKRKEKRKKLQTCS
jgi:hypothetical protein